MFITGKDRKNWVIGRMADWGIGRLGDWKIEGLEDLRIGRFENWKIRKHLSYQTVSQIFKS
jgi:hypothetical protein